MFLKLLIVAVLCVGAVVSIYDPRENVEKTKSYRRDPHIARALEQHHPRQASYVRDPIESRASQYHARLSTAAAPHQQSDDVERHARYGRPSQDYANNIDDNYSGCPAGFTGLLPYPYDCRRFVNCWKGRAYIQTCGPGTVFNGETMECDSPMKVVCKGLGGNANPNADTQPTEHHRFARIQKDDDVACPSGYTGLLPHPQDCSKFLNCASGTMHIQSCGPQTMFNPRAKVCDFTYKVDCTGRDGTAPVIGNRDGKTFEIIAQENQLGNQEQPQRKGWGHRHNHHGFPPRGPPSQTFTHNHSHNHNHNHNCTHAHHHHQSAPTPPVPTPTPTPSRTPLIYRDRWSTMNRTRPSTPTKTSTNWQPNRWTPIPVTTTTPQPSWQSHGSSGSSWTRPTTTTRPPSNYPNYSYGNSPNDSSNTSTTIYYAQPVDDDQPSEEVFSNVYGADISEITLPARPRTNASRGVFFPSSTHSNQPQPSNPSMDAINIPNVNLMPPLPSDDRQAPIPEQYPDYSVLYPSYAIPQPPPTNPKPVTPSRGVDSWSAHDSNHPSMDSINIPNINLMPPPPPSPTDDRQSRIPDYYGPYPSYAQPPSTPDNPRPLPPSRGADSWSDRDSSHPSMDAINIPNINLMPPHRETPNWPAFSEPSSSQSPPTSTTSQPTRQPLNPRWPSVYTPSEPHPGSSRVNTTSIFINSPPNEPPTWMAIDESNLYGGLLPPLPSDPEQPSSNDFTPFLPSSTPTPPFHASTTPPPGVKTNVHVFQIYPPPAVQNATTKIHPIPFYSPSYSGVAHSRNTTWSSPAIKTTTLIGSGATPRSLSSVHEDSFQPEIIFSHENGVVIPTTTNQQHGVSPPNYNREFYKQTTPSSVYQPPAETDSSDEVGKLPISEAIRLLLRPYFNRSGTVTDDMADKAESHIMNLARSQESPSTSTATTTTTSTTTVAPPDEIHKDVEIVFAGEQHSLTPNFVPPTVHSQVQTPSNYHQHQHQHHDRAFHRAHPHLLNPFANDENPKDESTTPRQWEELDPTKVAETNPAVDDVCQFDCGNGNCIKAFEVCDGVNNCGNRKDEQQCDHLGYEIRLSNEGSGRVEVKILGQWGYVCDDKFGIQDANVVCRELGFSLGASEVHGNSFYPLPDGGDVSFVMDEVDCIGNETSLKDCRFMGWGVSDCGPDEVVGLQCKTPVMTCPNDYWLCSTSKECIPPAFVCDNVPDCSDKSDESIAVCNSTVEFRLKGGRSKQEGRLEVLYRGVWGTICDDDFGQNEAQVACNSLGHYGPAKIVKNAFGPGAGPIWLDQVSCFGNESTIDSCNHWSWGEHNCNHTEDVSLKCTTGTPPRMVNAGVKGGPSSDVQTTTPDDIGMEFYPMERSSKHTNTRKVCGHFNANLTEELPREMERVVKGNVAKRGYHPWQATIRTKGRGGISSHWCGAVLISKKHILTAAHCLAGYPKGAYFIRLGDHYANIAESSEIDSYIENWYIHEKFREGTHMNNDIALIVMKNPVRFNDYIQPICLPPEGTEYEEGRRCTISGWGSIQSGVSTPSNNLRVADIPVIADDVCKLPHVYGNSITEGMFCAGYLEEGVDACEGDSGGPFVCSDSGAETLYGIISWGQQCGHANKPGVYVKIEKYLDWIYEKIRYSMQQT